MKTLGIILASVAIAVSIPSITKAVSADVVCTMQYEPVCGVLDGKERTFGNSCSASAEGATVLYKGECGTGGGSTGSVGVYTPPAGCTVWFDGCNHCSVGADGMSMCTLRACMGEPGPGYCIEYGEQPKPTTIPPSPPSGGSGSASVGGGATITVDPEPIATTTFVTDVAVEAKANLFERVWISIQTWISSWF